MNKLIGVMIGIFLLNSCNKKETITINRQTICDEYKKIPITDPIKRYAFLTAIKADYCSGNFDQCILDSHNISDLEYTNRLNQCPNNVPFVISVGDLESKFLQGNCLEDYVAFDIKNNSVTNLKNIKYINSIDNKYSIPMFKAIIKNFNLKSTDTFNFVCGLNKNKLEVMFNYPNGNSLDKNNGNVIMDPSYNIDFAILNRSNKNDKFEYVYHN